MGVHESQMGSGLDWTGLQQMQNWVGVGMVVLLGDHPDYAEAPIGTHEDWACGVLGLA